GTGAGGGTFSFCARARPPLSPSATAASQDRYPKIMNSLLVPKDRAKNRAGEGGWRRETGPTAVPDQSGGIVATEPFRAEMKLRGAPPTVGFDSIRRCATIKLELPVKEGRAPGAMMERLSHVVFQSGTPPA